MVDRTNCHLTNEETELLQTNFAQDNILISTKVLKKLDDILERVSLDLHKAFLFVELLLKSFALKFFSIEVNIQILAQK